MHIYPCIMTEPLQPREVRDVEELRTLAHPMRQRILRRLREAGTVFIGVGRPSTAAIWFIFRVTRRREFMHAPTWKAA